MQVILYGAGRKESSGTGLKGRMNRAAITLSKRTSQKKLLQEQTDGHLPMHSRVSTGKCLIHVQIELSTKFFFL